MRVAVRERDVRERDQGAALQPHIAARACRIDCGETVHGGLLAIFTFKHGKRLEKTSEGDHPGVAAGSPELFDFIDLRLNIVSLKITDMCQTDQRTGTKTLRRVGADGERPFDPFTAFTEQSTLCPVPEKCADQFQRSFSTFR